MIVRLVEPSDAAAIAALAWAAARSEWTEDYVRWKYFDNPLCGNFTFVAERDGELGGLYGNVPCTIQVGAQNVSGAQAVDMMVHPDWRREGLASRLVQASHAVMDASGLVLTYGLPNASSYAVLVERLQFDFLGWIPREVEVLDGAVLAREAGRRGPAAVAYTALLSTSRQLLSSGRGVHPRDLALQVEIAQGFDVRFDQIWEQVAPSLKVAVTRDRGYLVWRYTNHPMRRYVTYLAQRGGQPLGYIVLNRRQDAGRDVGIVAEFLLVPGEEAAGLALLAQAAAWANSEGCAQLQCWMLPQHGVYTRILRQAGFVFSQSRLAPRLFRYVTAFIVRANNRDPEAPSPLLLDNWFLSMGDQDHF